MTQLQRARTDDDSVDLVNQAVFEVDDRHACLAWAHGDEPPARSDRELQRSMDQGTHQFATGELPFARLLERINATHCEGSDVDAA